MLNIDAFYSLIRNYQATSFYIDPSNPAAAGSVLTNVGAVRTRGIEAEATVRPLEGLTHVNTNALRTTMRAISRSAKARRAPRNTAYPAPPPAT